MDFSFLKKNIKSYFKAPPEHDPKNFILVNDYLEKKQKEACQKFENLLELEMKNLGNWSSEKRTYERVYKKNFEKAVEELNQDIDAFQITCPGVSSVVEMNKPRYIQKLKDSVEAQKPFFQSSFLKMLPENDPKNFVLVDEFLEKKQKEASQKFENLLKLELKSYDSWRHKQWTYERVYERYCNKAVEDFKKEIDAFQKNCPDVLKVVENNMPRYIQKLKDCALTQKCSLWEISKVERNDAKYKNNADFYMKNISSELKSAAYDLKWNVKSISQNLEKIQRTYCNKQQRR